MSIEVSEKRLRNGELLDVIDELFAGTAAWEERHMDMRLGGVICKNGRSRKIPFFRTNGLGGRKDLLNDFVEFLKKEGVKAPEKSGSKFVVAKVLLGRSSGKSRSYFVADEKQVELIANKYTESHGGFVLVISHFSEKTESGSAMVEHAHALYRLPLGISKAPTFEEFLEEEYEED